MAVYGNDDGKGAARMPKPAKPLENIDKHLTAEEIAARERAEAEVLPSRSLDPEKPPRSLSGDNPARRYWRAILNKMRGFAILDELDADTLAVYCSMLSRRDAMNALCVKLVVEAGDKKLDSDARLALMDRADGLSSRLQTHEKTLLSYAKELGLTPTGRVQLARKRAAAAENPEPADDLFGD